MADIQSTIESAVLGLVYPEIRTAYPDLALAFENAPFDRNSPPPLWAEIDFNFTNASQVGPSARPITRQRGFVYVSVYAREGMGTKVVADVLGWFRSKLGYMSVDVVRMQTPQSVSDPGSIKGWFCRSLKVEFYADSY